MPTVVIIGGGPAGSVASLILARRGIDVTLIEQHRFPRDKVCGECISALGIEVLQRVNLADAVEQAGAIPLARASLHPADGDAITLSLPKMMWALSRRSLDGLLLQAAREAGAKIIQPARCEGITWHGRPAHDSGFDGESGIMGEPPMPQTQSQPLVTYRDLESNQVHPLPADWVIVADGKGALGSPRSKPTGDLGLKAHFTNVHGPRDRIELFGVQGHYVGAAQIEPDHHSPGGTHPTRWNVAFSVPVARVQAHRQDLDALWRALLLENAALAERFGAATRIGDWLASPLPRFGVVKHWPARVIPIGNAAAALEPIGGEGMGLALRSAELAAAAILKAMNHGAELDARTLRGEYQKLWTTRRAACRAMAMMLASPMLAASGLELARNDERLSRVVMGLIGKW